MMRLIRRGRATSRLDGVAPERFSLQVFPFDVVVEDEEAGAEAEEVGVEPEPEPEPEPEDEAPTNAAMGGPGKVYAGGGLSKTCGDV